MQARARIESASVIGVLIIISFSSTWTQDDAQCIKYRTIIVRHIVSTIYIIK